MATKGNRSQANLHPLIPAEDQGKNGTSGEDRDLDMRERDRKQLSELPHWEQLSPDERQFLTLLPFFDNNEAATSKFVRGTGQFVRGAKHKNPHFSKAIVLRKLQMPNMMYAVYTEMWRQAVSAVMEIFRGGSGKEKVEAARFVGELIGEVGSSPKAKKLKADMEPKQDGEKAVEELSTSWRTEQRAHKTAREARYRPRHPTTGQTMRRDDYNTLLTEHPELFEGKEGILAAQPIVAPTQTQEPANG